MTRSKTKRRSNQPARRTNSRNNNHKRRNQSGVAMIPYQRTASPAANRGGRRGGHRARNPKLGGLVMGAVWGVGGAMAGRAISGFIPLRLDGLAGIGLQFGVAYGVSWIFERFTNPQNALYAGIGAAGAPAAALVDYLFGMTKTLAQSTGIMGSGEAKAVAPPPPDTAKAQTVSGWDDGVVLGDVNDISWYDDSSAMSGLEDISYYPYQN